MAILEVPFIKQFHEDSCAVACLEMAFRYLRPSKSLHKFNQRKIFEKLAVEHPSNPTRKIVITDSLIEYARSRGLAAGWGRAIPVIEEMREHLTFFLDELKTPLLVNQRHNDDEYWLSHMVVIVGLNGDVVSYLDPEADQQLRVMSVEDCWNRWRPTPPGNVITGGVATWIARKELEVNPLLPDVPNAWWPHYWTPPRPPAI